MNVRKEIVKHADEADKNILLWLFERYHWQSEWRFVARCEHRRYGTHSYQTNRIWKPTVEGYALFKQLSQQEEREDHPT